MTTRSRISKGMYRLLLYHVFGLSSGGRGLISQLGLPFSISTSILFLFFLSIINPYLATLFLCLCLAQNIYHLHLATLSYLQLTHFFFLTYFSFSFKNKEIKIHKEFSFFFFFFKKKFKVIMLTHSYIKSYNLLSCIN